VSEDGLSEYRGKRRPGRTPEPVPAAGPGRATGSTSSPPSFVIQEHHASSLHWDFRLERDGVLVSWALPKGLPPSPDVNHLAVHVEDHPLEYGTFAGTIPEGEYGGGTVTVWDHGTYRCEKWNDHEVMVVLDGSRARGRYVLFPTRGKNWMIHRMDPVDGGYVPLPAGLKPMLATARNLPPDDGSWAYEFKWDGIRALVAVDGGRARARSRTGAGPEPTSPTASRSSANWARPWAATRPCSTASWSSSTTGGVRPSRASSTACSSPAAPWPGPPATIR